VSDLAELLASLSVVPRFSDPACRGSSRFDPRGDGESEESVRDRHDAALDICRSCRSRVECEEWFCSLDVEDRPVIGSVVAGRVVGVVEGLGERVSKQARIAELIEAYPDLSAPALARIAEVDPKTVRTWREKLAV
jgi:WhiB family redox-sensing transcriptional regulator